MGYKCVPQLTGLVRGTPKEGAKHRANGKVICQEAGNERYSRSATLDRARSKLNEYEGYKSGGKCWEDMEADAAAYRVKVKGKTKTGEEITREKGLPHNAVIGWAVIFNPPAEMTQGWTQKDYDRFDRDSFEVLGKIEPRLFREENLRMKVRHRDEGIEDEDGVFSDHTHRVGDAKDKDGRYCGNLIDAKLFVKINTEYPKLMRAKGWDLEDVDQTDFSRMGQREDGTYKDPEYRAERIAKRQAKPVGLPVNKHIARKIQENYTDAAQTMEQAIEQKTKARHEYIEADKARREAEREAEETKAAAKAEADKIKADAEAAAEARKRAIEAAADADRAEAARQLASAQEAARTYREGVSGVDFYRGLAEYAKTLKYPDGTTVLDRYEAQQKRQGQTMTAEAAADAISDAEARRRTDDIINRAKGTAATVNEKSRYNRTYQSGKEYS